MLGLAEVLVSLLTVLLLLQFVRLQHAAKRLPPGPTPLPILGNLWTLKFTLHYETLIQLAKKHGNIFTVWTGHSPVVVFNGYEAVKDALVSNSDATSGRPLNPTWKAFSKERGVVLSNGHNWKQQRRFIAVSLRHLTLATQNLESRMQEEVKYLLQEFTSLEGSPANPCHLIEISTANVISSMMFGHRFPANDDYIAEVVKIAISSSHFLGSNISQLYNAFPRIMEHLPGPHKSYFAQLEHFHNHLKEKIRHHQETNNTEPRNLIDFYLTQISMTRDDPDSTFDEDNMILVLSDLFLAGTETILNTLLWALLYMVAYPDIQERVQLELDTNLEPLHVIQYEDSKNLPYTNAVIHEVQRISSVLPIALPHLCLKDTIMQGFLIPKGTVLLVNLMSVHHDSKHWETPEQFNPNHFLDKDGKFMKNEAYFPFSAGHRTCVGEHLARLEFFQFFSNLLRQFSFKLPDGINKVNLDPDYGLTLRPTPYQICAVTRNVPHS